MSATFLSSTAYVLDHHRDALSCFGPFSSRNDPYFAAGGLLR